MAMAGHCNAIKGCCVDVWSAYKWMWLQYCCQISPMPHKWTENQVPGILSAVSL